MTRTRRANLSHGSAQAEDKGPDPDNDNGASDSLALGADDISITSGGQLETNANAEEREKISRKARKRGAGIPAKVHKKSIERHSPENSKSAPDLLGSQAAVNDMSSSTSRKKKKKRKKRLDNLQGNVNRVKSRVRSNSRDVGEDTNNAKTDATGADVAGASDQDGEDSVSSFLNKKKRADKAAKDPILLVQKQDGNEKGKKLDSLEIENKKDGDTDDTLSDQDDQDEAGEEVEVDDIQEEAAEDEDGDEFDEDDAYDEDGDDANENEEETALHAKSVEEDSHDPQVSSKEKLKDSSSIVKRSRDRRKKKLGNIDRGLVKKLSTSEKKDLKACVPKLFFMKVPDSDEISQAESENIVNISVKIILDQIAEPEEETELVEEEPLDDIPQPEKRTRSRSTSKTMDGGSKAVSQKSQGLNVPTGGGGMRRRMLPLRGNRTSVPASTKSDEKAESRSIYQEASTEEEEEKEEHEEGKDDVTPDSSKAAEQKEDNKEKNGGADTTGSSTFLGDDGNKFHCHICHQVGNVVCCDGCPNVYHTVCLPRNSRSRISLEKDDDPWYCPECFKQRDRDDKVRGNVTVTKVGRGGRRRGRRRADSEVSQKDRIDDDKDEQEINGKDVSDYDDDDDETNSKRSHHRKVGSGGSNTEVTRSKKNSKKLKAGKEDEGGGTESAKVHPAGQKKRKKPSSIWANLSSKRSIAQPSLAPSARSWSYDVEAEGRVSGAGSSSGEENHEEKSSRKKKGRKKKDKGKKRKSHDDATEGSNQQSVKPSTKKKRHKRSRPSSPVHALEYAALVEPPSPIKRPVKAYPAFYFFLKDNRRYLLKTLTKQKNLVLPPKGLERNKLLAREGAKEWSSKTPEERLFFTNLAMKDFERRVRQWKESADDVHSHFVSNDSQENSLIVPQHLRTLQMEESPGDDKNEFRGGKRNKRKRRKGNSHGFDDDGNDLYPNSRLNRIFGDERLQTFGSRSRRRHFRTPSVAECVPHTRRGTGANDILLELLQDTRFHPIPLVHPIKRKDCSRLIDDSKITIPQFEVQGPVSTSVGDSCLGCTRGWCHFCPVLKRQFPSVEHRAKLQPPVSSHMATRIALEKTSRDRANDRHRMSRARHLDDSTRKRGAENANNESSRTKSRVGYLFEPRLRLDDILQFTEECIAAKLPSVASTFESGENEPPNKKSKVAKGEENNMENQTDMVKDASIAHSVDDGTGIGEDVFQCKCKTIVHSKYGCINCRRTLMVKHLSKRLGAGTKSGDDPAEVRDDGAGMLKVQTAMLGRHFLCNGGYDRQKDCDRAIATVLSGSDWKPNVIMPSRWPPSLSNHAGSEQIRESSHHKVSSQGGLNFNTSSPFPVVVGSSSESFSHLDLRNSSDRDGNLIKSTMDGITPPFDNCEGSLAPTDGPSRRRTLRSGHAFFGNYDRPASPESRQAMAETYQDEAKVLAHNCLSVSICGIFLGLVRRDPYRLFASVSNAVETDGDMDELAAMNFRTIRSKILSDGYTSLNAFVSDSKQLCKNAIVKHSAGSLHADTAKEVLLLLDLMQKRAMDWTAAIKSAHASSLTWRGHYGKEDGDRYNGTFDPFADLRRRWPGAMNALESEEWYRSQVRAYFVRTKENESAYYGSLAIRRAATAAAASLSSPDDCTKGYAACVLRSAAEDEELRRIVDERVAKLSHPIRSLDEPGWREVAVLNLMKRVQSRRVERCVASDSGCARCDGACIEQEAKLAMAIEAEREGDLNKAMTVPRVDASRLQWTTGLGSKHTASNVSKADSEQGENAKITTGNGGDEKRTLNRAVSVRGSNIHGWGVFADQSFAVGEVVTEYVGEYILDTVATVRKKLYQKSRIQDYLFRVSGDLVIDATLRGCHSRYINHSCDPNCCAQVIEVGQPDSNLKRVMIVAQREIKAGEEITYDYQFDLEHDLKKRIPCSCGSEKCRGFMNWTLPELDRADEVVKEEKHDENPEVHGDDEQMVGKVEEVEGSKSDENKEPIEDKTSAGSPEAVTI